MPTIQEIAFHSAMIEIYRRALSEVRYRATDFIGMVTTRGGLPTAKSLLATKDLPSGFTALRLLNRIDLTMEAMILNSDEWPSLFTPEELQIAFDRLIKAEYIPKWNPKKIST